jgi:hypothetical protein
VSRPFEHQRRKRHGKSTVETPFAPQWSHHLIETLEMHRRPLPRSNLLGRSAKDHNGDDHRTVFPRRETAVLFYINDKTRPARRRSKVCSPRAASCDLRLSRESKNRSTFLSQMFM